MRCKCPFSGSKADIAGQSPQPTRVFIKNMAMFAHGLHDSFLCACTPYFKMLVAHSLKASTIASFDTNDFGHAKEQTSSLNQGNL